MVSTPFLLCIVCSLLVGTGIYKTSDKGEWSFGLLIAISVKERSYSVVATEGHSVIAGCLSLTFPFYENKGRL